MSTSLPALEIAYRGRVRMLRMLFGGSAPDGTDCIDAAPVLTSKLFSAMFGGARG